MASDWQDPYTYPGTDVLRNKLGIQDAAALRQAEYELTALRGAELAASPIKGNFDLAHMKAIHGHLFQDVYDWAGEIRTVDIGKGGSWFTHTGFIETTMAAWHKTLVDDNFLRGLDKTTFVERFADHYGSLNAAHIFREGNGRSTREFIGQLAEQAGYTLDQTKIDNSKGAFNEAARASFVMDMEPIKEFFSDAVRHTRAVSFERLPEIEAVAKHPELRGAYAELRQAEAQAEKLTNPEDRASFIANARSEISQKLEAGTIVRGPVQSQSLSSPSRGGEIEP